MKIGTGERIEGQERRGRIHNGAVEAVELSDPERVYRANQWAFDSPGGSGTARDPALERSSGTFSAPARRQQWHTG